MQFTVPARRSARSAPAAAAVVLILLAAVGVSVVRPGVAWASGGELVGPIPGKNWASYSAKVGAGGRVVAFATWLRNFDSSAPLPLVGVYVRDRVAQTSESMVRPFGGGLPDGNSYPLGVSPEAGTRYVLYSSVASNVVSGDANGNSDVFLFDRVALTTERVSVGVGGVEGNGGTIRAAMSGNTAVDGTPPRYVAFVSSSSNLVAGDTNGKSDVFLRDRVAGTTTLVSRGVGGVPADGDSFDVSVSDNGRYVAFSSAASNVVAGDANGSSDVFVRDMVAGTTERVSVGFVGEASGSSSSPQISADGRFVAFDSDADDLVSGDDNLSYDVFVRDRLSGSTERVSVGPSGQQGEDDSESPSMSRDGRYIAFDSDAEEFSDLDGNISTDVYVRDRLARNTARASEKANGLDAFSDATGGSISPEGRFVGFDTDSSDYKEATDTNDDYDVYLKDMGTPFYGNPTIGNRFNGVAPKRLLDTAGNRCGRGQTGRPDRHRRRHRRADQCPGGDGEHHRLERDHRGSGSGRLPEGPDQTDDRRPVATARRGGFERARGESGYGRQDQLGYGDGGHGPHGRRRGLLRARRRRCVYGCAIRDRARHPVCVGSVRLAQGSARAGGGAYATLDLPVAGAGGVPADARAVALYVTALAPGSAGSKLSVYPTGSPNSASGGVLPQVGMGVANLLVVPVGANGKVSLNIDKGSTHVMASVAGYFGPFGDGLFFPLNPTRVLDNLSAASSQSVPGLTGPLAPGAMAVLPVAGRGGVPSDARAVSLSLSATSATAWGILMTWPSGAAPMFVSHLDPRPGTNVANTLMPAMGTNGSITVLNFSPSSVNVLGDVYGSYR